MAKPKPRGKRKSPPKAPSEPQEAPEKPAKAPKAGKAGEPSPEEMKALWHALAPETRNSVLIDSKLESLIKRTYRALSERLLSLGIAPTDPLIIASDGSLYDPDEYLAEEADDDDLLGDEDDDDDDLLGDDEDDDDDLDVSDLDGKALIKDLKKWHKSATLWAQGDIAKWCNVSQSAVAAWLNGRVKSPRDEEVLKGLHYLLQIDPESDPDAVLNDPELPALN